MTRKDKFLSVMKSKGYNHITDLMIEVESVRLGSKSKGREVATKCKNYSNMISQSNNKDFSRDYIIALEKVLDMKYIEMIDPNYNSTPTIKYDTFKSIAYENNYQKTKDFILKHSAKEPIIHRTDEFGFYFIDYIIEYASINCLKFLVEFEDFTHVWSGHSSYYYTKNHEELDYNLIKLIAKHEDVELLTKLYDPFRNIAQAKFDHKNIYEEEEFIKPILESKKIINKLFEIRELDILKVNHGLCNFNFEKGLFANMLINGILKLAMREPEKYNDIIELILEESYKLNEKIVNYFKIKEEQFKIDDKGFIIYDSRIVVGQVVRYNNIILPNTPPFIKNQVEKNENLLSELIYKTSYEYGKRKNVVVDGKLYVVASNNDIQYEMMKYMNELKYSKIPILYGHDIDNNLDIIEYKKTINNKISVRNEECITELASFLKDFHKYSEEKLGAGKVYVHGNLHYTNLSFKDNKLEAVTNWSNCKIGNKLEDIMYVLCTWTDMTNFYRIKEEVFDNINKFISIYELDPNVKIGDELEKFLNQCLLNLNVNSSSYEQIYENIKFTLIFVELHKEKLNERRF